jgi:hypothetical protein
VSLDRSDLLGNDANAELTDDAKTAGCRCDASTVAIAWGFAQSWPRIAEITKHDNGN